MPTSNNNRSSIDLRSRKIPNINKNQSNKVSITSYSKSPSLMIQTQAQFNISPTKNTIKNEITEMKESIEMLRTDLSNSICEAESKENHYKNIVSQLQCEIKDIKTFNLFLLTQIRVGSFTSFNKKQDLGFYKMYDKNEFKNQIADLSGISTDNVSVGQIINNIISKDNDLSEKIDKMTVDFNKVNRASNIKQFQTMNSNNCCDCEYRIDALEKEIEDINISIKNINQMCVKSNNAWPLMNNQLHVLSAKFIKFNTKINVFLYDFQKKKSTISSEINVTDEDAMHYAIHDQQSEVSNNQSKHCIDTNTVIESLVISTENEFASKEKKNQRIHGIINQLDYTRCIKVAMHNTNIVNLKSLPNEVYRYFNSTLGSNVAQCVNINKFTMLDDSIYAVSVYVTFKDPLSYDFIQNFKFPSNWFFISTGEMNQKH